MESIVDTKAATILQFFAGLRGTLWVTFEEGTCAAGCTICSIRMWRTWCLQSAEERPAEIREQERSDRCPKAG
jgi:hypothetical protein